MTIPEINSNLLSMVVDEEVTTDANKALVLVAIAIVTDLMVDKTMGHPGKLSPIEVEDLLHDQMWVVNNSPRFYGMGKSFENAMDVAYFIVGNNSVTFSAKTFEYTLLKEEQVESPDSILLEQEYQEVKAAHPRLTILPPKKEFITIPKQENGILYSEDELPF